MDDAPIFGYRKWRPSSFRRSLGGQGQGIAGWVLEEGHRLHMSRRAEGTLFIPEYGVGLTQSIRMMSWPRPTLKATSRGVSLAALVRTGSQPAAIRASITSVRLSWAAMCRGVSPW